MQRNLAIDGFRGLLLCIIAINHLGGLLITKLTREPFGFVSAAEGFVFLSGLVAAMVYSKHLSDPNTLSIRIFKRVGVIYLFAMAGVLTIALLTQINLVPLPIKDAWQQFFIPSTGNWFNFPMETLFLNLLQIHQTSYHDILVVYMLPMLFLPIILKGLHNGKAPLILIISFCVWGAAQFINQDHGSFIFKALNQDMVVSMGNLDVFAWQLLFVTGAVIGYFSQVKQVKFISQSKSVNIGILLLGLGLMALRRLQYTEISETKVWGLSIIDTSNLGPLRLLNVAILVYLFSFLIQKVPGLFKFPYFVFLGKHSLQVFVFHSVMVYFLMVILFPIKENPMADIGISIGFVLLLAIPAYLHKLWQQRGTNAQKLTVKKPKVIVSNNV